MLRNLLLTIVLLLLLIHCASSSKYSSKSAHYDPHFITEDEIRDATVFNAHELIKANRPRWFHGNRFRGFDGDKVYFPHIYMDQTQLTVYQDTDPNGFREILRKISLKNVREIEFIRPEDSVVYGSDHKGGIIIVRMLQR